MNDAEDAKRWRYLRDVVLFGEKRGDMPYKLADFFYRTGDKKFPSVDDLDEAVDTLIKEDGY